MATKEQYNPGERIWVSEEIKPTDVGEGLPSNANIPLFTPGEIILDNDNYGVDVCFDGPGAPLNTDIVRGIPRNKVSPADES